MHLDLMQAPAVVTLGLLPDGVPKTCAGPERVVVQTPKPPLRTSPSKAGVVP